MTASNTRSLQEIAAKKLVADMEALMESLIRFGVVTSPSGVLDSIGKIARVRNRIALYQHKDDRK